jgi:DNA processing protein
MTPTCLACGGHGYPPLLAAIHDPPKQLWLRGRAGAELLARASVAIVGARACSSYGRAVARSLARDLAAAGVVVVSGMARGVDGEAHRGALDGGGPTVAVLGCGIDRDYPVVHAELARRIVETGLVVSEYPPGIEPAPWRFPARNRIISGLSRAVVVVEARERSGALITVDFALEQGRDVLVVPGEITSALSAGVNALLRHGAAPVLRVDDILEAIGVVAAAPMLSQPAGPAARVLAAVRETPATADEIARIVALPAAEVAALLTELELDGLVEPGEGAYRATIAR